MADPDDGPLLGSGAALAHDCSDQGLRVVKDIVAGRVVPGEAVDLSIVSVNENAYWELAQTVWKEL